MAHPLQNRFEENALKALKEVYGEDIDEEALKDILEEHVEVDDPEYGRIYNMAGRVMDAKRKEPIKVRLNLPTGAAIGSSILAGVHSPDMLVIGAALLAIYGAVAQDRVSEIKPDIALTYAVGWELSQAGSELVSREELEERVIKESQEHPEKILMTEKDVEDALWELKDMGSVKLKKVRGEELLQFKEKSTLTYK